MLLFRTVLLSTAQLPQLPSTQEPDAQSSLVVHCGSLQWFGAGLPPTALNRPPYTRTMSPARGRGGVTLLIVNPPARGSATTAKSTTACAEEMSRGASQGAPSGQLSHSFPSAGLLLAMP